MCGIAGIWYRDGRPVDETSLRRMAAMLKHRGPDAEGVWRDGDLGLSHRRLRIIDLSDRADQPMLSSDGRYCVTFNGEIHNYRELRSELESVGHTFASRSDTEVILAAFTEWGDAAFERFNGMWALALWDAHRRELRLCRDRFGIKPLCYSVRGQRLAFASEPKAILSAFPEERLPNRREMHGFLAGCFPDVGEDTFFANIRSAPPAHVLVFSQDGAHRRPRYWKFEPGREERSDNVEEAFRALMKDAVRLRMRSDVPIASSLSGGLDSTTVTRLAAGMSRTPLECYSLKYDEAGFDESAYAAIAGADPERYRMHWVRPRADDMADIMRRIVWHQDSPPTARGNYPSWFIMEAVGQSCRVALTGDGSDEMLAGYTRFFAPYLLDLLLSRRAWSRTELGALRQVYDTSANLFRRLLVGPARRALRLEAWPFMRVESGEFRRAYGPADPARFPESWVHPTSRPYRSHLNNALWHEFTVAGLTETLHSHDAMSMAFSVEARSPFLDHRLVEFCFSLPYHEKIRDGWTKSVLRRALKDELPDAIRCRRQKLGFPVPLPLWMRRSDNLAAFAEILMDGTCVAAGIFDRGKVEQQLSRLARPGRGPGIVEPLWRWVCLELWHAQFVAQPLPEFAGAPAASDALAATPL